MNIGERIKELRTLNKLSQDELSKILNIKQNTLSQYEKGKREPSLELLKLIAEKFNVTTDYLLGITDKIPGIIKKAGE